MNLDQLKDRWQSLEAKEEDPPVYNTENIRQIIVRNYRRRLWRVLLPEMFFAAVYLYFVVLLVGFFQLMDTSPLRIIAALTIALLLGLPVLRFYLLRRLFRLTDPVRPHVVSLRDFARYKLRFLSMQRAQAGIGFVLLTALAVLTTKIYGEFDVTRSKYFWALLFSVGFLVVVGINFILLRRYRKAIAGAEALLNDLEHE